MWGFLSLSRQARPATLHACFPITPKLPIIAPTNKHRDSAINFFQTLANAFAKDSPVVVLLGFIGVALQFLYATLRDRSNDKRAEKAAELEHTKFEHQKKVEEVKFQYEQQRWREQLATQLALKQVDTRLVEYSSLWAKVDVVAKNRMDGGHIQISETKILAAEVKSWRYSAGGLLAEPTTRDAAYAFQRALWNYDGTDQSYKSVRTNRRILRDALRADMGISEDMFGRSIIDVAAEKQRLKSDLAVQQGKLGIVPGEDG